jgi:transposase
MNSICWSSPDSFLEFLHICEGESSFHITIQSTHQSSLCPHCGVRSFRPHSCYTRLIQDLPIGEKSASLLLISKKWFCDNNSCDKNIFTERYDWLPAKGRRTYRAEEVLRKIAFASSCSNGEKVAKAIHLPVSHDVLLSIIRKTEIKPDISPFCRN